MFGQIHELSKWLHTGRKAMDSGGVMRTRTSLDWDISGRCESPVHQTITGRPRPRGMAPWAVRARVYDGMRRDIDLLVRCGRCGPCLRARAARWRLRAQSELSHTRGRTWFVTLTLAPEAHFKALLAASLRLEAQGVDFDRLTDAEQFAERHREIGPEITRWIKRVRKESGSQIRYVLVAEPHTGKSGKGTGANLGLPHYHLLVHEQSAEAPLRSRTMRKQWKLGFSKVRLVAQDAERRTASYVAKYLTKSACARVRASVGYGQENQPSLSEHNSPCGSVSVANEKPPLTPPTKSESGAGMGAALAASFLRSPSTFYVDYSKKKPIGFITSPLPRRVRPPGRPAQGDNADPDWCPF